MIRISILKNIIQEYEWGSRTAIAELLGDASPADKPQAELWMGAHPKASSLVWCEGKWISLIEWIENNPEGILGKRIATRFSNQLPFLFKVLAAAKPLSIQAHPDLDQAREGFRRESTMEIPLNAPHRNYKDANHKPEIICALTPFWALDGFRRLEDIIQLVSKIGSTQLAKEFSVLKDQPEGKGLKKFFHHVMTMDQKRQERIVEETIVLVKKNTVNDSIFEWMIRLYEEYPKDIGVLSPLFLNLVHLQPGEALFLPAGDLHAYLHGVGIELMANSDNVLRGGLTPKHVDVSELLNVLRFEEREIHRLIPRPLRTGEKIYETPAEEFVLSVISVGEDRPFMSPRDRSVEIMICLEGEAVVQELPHGDFFSLSRGASIVVPASVDQYRIEGNGTFYKAGVPRLH